MKYITVNAQEDQATIKSALERLKIEPTTSSISTAPRAKISGDRRFRKSS